MSGSAVRSYNQLRSAFPHGVASVRQLMGFGFDESTIYRRCLDGGPWQRVLPGVVLLFTGAPTRDQDVRAALLLCDRGAAVTGLEACRRYGLRRGPLREPGGREVHVLIPHARQRRTVGFVHVERTHRMPEVLFRGGFPLATLPRACMDAARRLRPAGDVVELLSEPVQRGLCSVAALGEELEAGSRRGTAAPRRVLSNLTVGVRSAAEMAARDLWRTTGLPEPWWNAAVHERDGTLLGIVDRWLDDVAMAWEIESTEWHLSPADHDRTVERASRLTAAGVVYSACKPSRILRDPASVTATLRATYEHAKARSRPPLIATPARTI